MSSTSVTAPELFLRPERSLDGIGTRTGPVRCPLLLLTLLCACGLLGCKVHMEMGVLDEKEQMESDQLLKKMKSRAIAKVTPLSANRASENTGENRPVSAWQPREVGTQELVSETEPEVTEDSEPLPIDLATVLRLAGAQNWNVELAAERVREARAVAEAADAYWMPSLIGGLGFTRHDGQLQATSGATSDVSRSSLFVGGGAALGGAPLAGGGGGPLRLMVNLSLADAIFKPLVARQHLAAVEAAESSTFNDTLLTAGSAYFRLVAAQGRLVNTQADLKEAEALLQQTQAFVISGKGSKADSARMAADVGRRRQMVVSARADLKVSSARLARELRLDPSTTLFAFEEQLVPIELIDGKESLASLIDQAQVQRPELVTASATIEAARASQQAERWRPLLPHLTLGGSAGGFGGGVDDELPGLSARSDFDVLAVWQWENLGFGTRAARDAAGSRRRQAELQLGRIKDGVSAEVTTAWHEVQAGKKRIELSEVRIKQAGNSLRLNRARIRGLLGLPLEALQAVEAVSQAREARLRSIIDFNQAQLRLLRAVGRPGTAE